MQFSFNCLLLFTKIFPITLYSFDPCILSSSYWFRWFRPYFQTEKWKHKTRNTWKNVYTQKKRKTCTLDQNYKNAKNKFLWQKKKKRSIRYKILDLAIDDSLKKKVIIYSHCTYIICVYHIQTINLAKNRK